MQRFTHHRLHQAYTFAFIKPRVLVSDELLSSFNVVLLFTNIPVHLVTEVAQRRLRGDADLKDRTGLSVEEVMKLLEFCLSATFLSFCGGIYQQTFGTAMGSPVSVSIANVIEDVREGTGNHGRPPELLEALRGRHLRSTPCLKCAAVLGPPQWCGTQHTVHS